MMRFRPLLLVPVFWLIISCGQQKPPANQVIARVGDTYLTRPLVEQLIPETVAKADRNYYIRQLAEQWVNSEVLAQAALQDGLSLTEMEKWQVDKMRSEVLSLRYLNERIPYDIQATPEEISDYYEKHIEQFKRQRDEVHLVHLFFRELDKTIVAEIKKSKNLIEVIEKNYLAFQVSPILERNGDLGYVPVESLQDNFRKAIRGEKTGLVYGPIKSSDGFHYLQVLDRKPAGSTKQLSLVRSEISVRIAYLKRMELTRQLKEEARKKIEVETFYTNIL